MSYKPRSLFSLIEDISNNNLFLPHIQRPFVWDEEQMMRLLDSLMRSFPVQTLLFWRTKQEIKTRRFMAELDRDAELSKLYDKTRSLQDVEKVFVLDGQQRLQTLFTLFCGSIKENGVLLDTYIDATSGISELENGMLYDIRFSSSMLDMPFYKIKNLYGKDNQKNSEELAEEINNMIDSVIPLEGEELKKRQRLVRRNIGQLVSLLREERFFWIEQLDGIANDYPYDKILNIFVRVNSGGTKLDAADLMFAAMKEAWTEIEENVESVVHEFNQGRLKFDKNFVLKSLMVTIGKGADLKPRKFQGPEGDNTLQELEGCWLKAEKTFYSLRDFITNELKLYHDKVVRSYLGFVPLFDYLYHNPNPTPGDILLMKAYYYKAQMFNWYSSQTDNTINALHLNIVGKKTPNFPLLEIMTYFEKNRRADVRLDPAKGIDMRLRYIVLNLIYVERFGSSPFNVRYTGNEPHIDHIYPKSELYKMGLATQDINHVGNYRFVGAAENIRKRAEHPDSYFSRLMKDGVHIEHHLLCPNESHNPSLMKMEESIYKSFRDRRASLVFDIVRKVVDPI